MTLKQFESFKRQGKRIAKAQSCIQGRWAAVDDYYVYDGFTFDFTNGASYTLKEAVYLAKSDLFRPRDAKAVHMVKSVFDGDLIVD